jgi:iron complex outermembrane receptor protein
MFQSNKNKGEEVLIPKYNMFDIGGFIYTRKNYDNLSISGGLRYDLRSVDSKSFVVDNEQVFQSFSKSFSNVSGSIGLSWLVSKQVTLKANIARGFRSPNMPELASNGTHEGTNRYEYGEQDLKPETSLQFDAGFEFNSEHISLTANVFRNNIDDFIFYKKLRNAAGGDSTVEVDGEFIPAFKFDQRKANLTGLEITMDLHPHPLDWLHFENSFSWVRGKFSDRIESSLDLPLIPAPRVLSELRGDFLEKGKRIRNLSIKLELDHNFNQNNAFTAYDTETSTPSYTLLNTGVSADFVRKNKTLFSIFLNVINVADVAYQNHLSRLKYTAVNPASGRMGVYNMGRNFSVKLFVPLEFEL